MSGGTTIKVEFPIWLPDRPEMYTSRVFERNTPAGVLGVEPFGPVVQWLRDSDRIVGCTEAILKRGSGPCGRPY
jgi:hypothetical protein